MTDHIYGINPSDETIIVAPTELHAAYGQTADTAVDYIGLYIKDVRLGELFIPIGLTASAELVANVVGILGSLDAMRAGWRQQQ